MWRLDNSKAGSSPGLAGLRGTSPSHDLDDAYEEATPAPFVGWLQRSLAFNSEPQYRLNSAIASSRLVAQPRSCSDGLRPVRITKPHIVVVQAPIITATGFAGRYEDKLLGHGSKGF